MEVRRRHVFMPCRACQAAWSHKYRAPTPLHPHQILDQAATPSCALPAAVWISPRRRTRCRRCSCRLLPRHRGESVAAPRVKVMPQTPFLLSFPLCCSRIASLNLRRKTWSRHNRRTSSPCRFYLQNTLGELPVSSSVYPCFSRSHTRSLGPSPCLAGELHLAGNGRHLHQDPNLPNESCGRAELTEQPCSHACPVLVLLA